ncbi:MAG: endonuclease III domain-containing protein [Candidatus Woesearchaeota archaeon]
MKTIKTIYERLIAEYKPQGWWPLIGHDGKNPTKTGYVNGYHPEDYDFPKDNRQKYEICIGAILTQNTSWPNVEKALINLEKKGLIDPKKIDEISAGELGNLIRPAGYFNQKAKKLKIFSKYFIDLDYRIPKREELLSLWGIGPETADSMLLYAFRIPVFVVDAYTKRIFTNLGIIDPKDDYETIRKLFEDNLEKDLVTFQEYHALIVEHAKNFYRKKEDYSRCFLKNHNDTI